MWRQRIIVDKAAGSWPKTDEFVPLSYFSANRMDTNTTGFVDYTHFPHLHLPGNRVFPFFGELFPYSPMYNILLDKCKDKWATPRASEPSPGSFQIRGGGAGSCLPHHSWEPIQERGTKRSKQGGMGSPEYETVPSGGTESSWFLSLRACDPWDFLANSFRIFLRLMSLPHPILQVPLFLSLSILSSCHLQLKQSWWYCALWGVI